MENTSYPITLYRSKSQLAEALGINRKTIQRMVSKGELSQDSKGRVRIDELIAILKVSSMRVKRGPKIQLDISIYNKKTYNYNGNTFEVEILKMDELTVSNETVDHEILKNIINKISGLNSATLEAIANQAMLICQHKRRLAKVGVSFDASKILKILYSI
jgi:polyhydroxyalkanoate synthesis regulator phasin